MRITNRYTALLQTTCVILFLLIHIRDGAAQISPGDLTKAHAHLEGILNCTKCHVLGDKVSNDKCLECHKDIKSRVDQRKGYHASKDVSGKDCFACHSEHHGRNFEIIRFDANRFDHQLTGYPLTGAHQKQECVACHKKENIESAEIRKKDRTYLGLNTKCFSCHTDVHQNTLSTNCASCHSTASFTPAPGFDHNQTDFLLKGKHVLVDCRKCHEVTVTNNVPFQRFADIPFSSCASCHQDVHNKRFGTNCKECHTEESFSQFAGKSNFNHNLTAFPLVGKHKRMNCASCHQMGASVQPAQIFKDYKGKDFKNCNLCHQDVHETKFGSDCRSCHTEESFSTLLHPDRFDHILTGYALEGKHRNVDCRKCHTSKMTEPLVHNRCMDCHQDFHRGQFIRDVYQSDCTDCHTVAGFSGSTFTIEQHNEGSFPLTGAHLATPCFACHLQDDTWNFRLQEQQCTGCHTDIHEGNLSRKYDPEKTCTGCHTTDTWSEVKFDHTATSFVLEGRHEVVSCTSCHIPEPDFGTIKNIPFTGLAMECVACHDNIHGTQFEESGGTDCRQCHDFLAWIPGRFDHSTARFALTGAHLNVACDKCHPPALVDGKMVVQYRLERFECVDCHR